MARPLRESAKGRRTAAEPSISLNGNSLCTARAAEIVARACGAKGGNHAGATLNASSFPFGFEEGFGSG